MKIRNEFDKNRFYKRSLLADHDYMIEFEELKRKNDNE
jgi:hypothetical protein